MQYLVIMGVLIAVAVVLIIIIMVALMRGKQEEQGYDEDGEEEEGQDEDEEEIEDALQKRRRRPASAQEHSEHNTRDEGPSVIGQDTGNQGGEGRQDGPGEKRDPGRKLWKLVLENLGNWQKSTFVFYENIGIGRGQGYPQFEKFMTIGADPRISKLHCAIIQKDRKLYLKDMGSRNGTYLNGKRISQPVLLQREDIISVGETEIEVQSMMREKD